MQFLFNVAIFVILITKNVISFPLILKIQTVYEKKTLAFLYLKTQICKLSVEF